MSVSITCRACGAVLTAETEDGLAELGAEHGASHGHEAARLTHDAALARVRHSAPKGMPTSSSRTSDVEPPVAEG